jgi:hypothetical protein
MRHPTAIRTPTVNFPPGEFRPVWANFSTRPLVWLFAHTGVFVRT